VAALHQGMPGQMTWLEDPPPWLPSSLLLCFCNRLWTENKNLTVSDRFVLFWQWNNLSGIGGLFWCFECNN